MRRPRPLIDSVYGRLASLTASPVVLPNSHHGARRARSLAQLKRFFPKVPRGALCEALTDLVSAGKVRVVNMPLADDEVCVTAYYVLRS